jgi:hypothetical protein
MLKIEEKTENTYTIETENQLSTLVLEGNRWYLWYSKNNENTKIFIAFHPETNFPQALNKAWLYFVKPELKGIF